jgi:peptide methionine sulfoxide reductase msrA/msrB
MKRTLVVSLLVLAGAAATYFAVSARTVPPTTQHTSPIDKLDKSGLAVATFAGGCFWCVEAAFQEVPGVREVYSGYSGGDFDKPTYKLVAYGLTNHTEAVQVYFDAKKITYEGLLQVLWRTADPTDTRGQFSDRGRQYRPAIFYHNDEQRQAAIRSRDELAKSGPFVKPIKIEIAPFKGFYVAEDYHQDYYKKNPLRYQFYTIGSGRAGFQLDTWGDDLEVDFTKYKPNKKPGLAPLANAM